MTADVELVVEGVRFDSTDTETLWPEGYWSVAYDFVTLTVFVEEGQDAVEETADTIKRIVSYTPHATVTRVFEEEVTAHQIAMRANVTEETVTGWLVTEPTFPTSSQRLFNENKETFHIWLWRDIVRWLGEEKNITLDDNLPNEETVARINFFLATGIVIPQ